MYHNRFLRCREVFVNQYGNNLLNGFRRFFEAGKLELITCGATHGFLPLMQHQLERRARPDRDRLPRVRAALRQAAAGHLAAGVRLRARASTSCSRDAGIRYFFTDTHGVLFAEPRPKYGVYAPILCPETRRRRPRPRHRIVQAGLERHRRLPRRLQATASSTATSASTSTTSTSSRTCTRRGIRSHLGIKYYKITGRTEHKEPYDPHAALDKAAEHAGNFMFNREKQVEWLSGSMDGRPSLIVAPYDAELFGHWWFEGPDWINFLLRKMHYDQQTVKTITDARVPRPPSDDPGPPAVVFELGLAVADQTWFGMACANVLNSASLSLSACTALCSSVMSRETESNLSGFPAASRIKVTVTSHHLGVPVMVVAKPSENVRPCLPWRRLWQL